MLSMGQWRAFPGSGSWSRRSSHTRATTYGHVFLCFRLCVAQRLHGAELRAEVGVYFLVPQVQPAQVHLGSARTKQRKAADKLRGEEGRRGRGEEMGKERWKGDEGRLTCHRTGTSRSSSRSSRPGKRGWGRWSGVSLACYDSEGSEATLGRLTVANIVVCLVTSSCSGSVCWKWRDRRPWWPVIYIFGNLGIWWRRVSRGPEE